MTGGVFFILHFLRDLSIIERRLYSRKRTLFRRSQFQGCLKFAVAGLLRINLWTIGLGLLFYDTYHKHREDLKESEIARNQ